MLFRALGGEIVNLDPAGITSRGWATAWQVSDCFLGLTLFPDSKMMKAAFVKPRNGKYFSKGLRQILASSLFFSPASPVVESALEFSFH